MYVWLSILGPCKQILYVKSYKKRYWIVTKRTNNIHYAVQSLFHSLESVYKMLGGYEVFSQKLKFIVLAYH